MRWSMVVLVVGVSAFGVQAYATIINVPSDQPTIQAGIDASLVGQEPHTSRRLVRLTSELLISVRMSFHFHPDA